MNSTDYWTNKKNHIIESKDNLSYEDYTKELLEVYSRHLEIIEEILEDLAPEAEDDQYCETTSWHYEEELKYLEKKTKELEPIVEARIEQERHQELLKDLGMTQEQYDVHLEEISEMRIQERKKRNRKK